MTEHLLHLRLAERAVFEAIASQGQLTTRAAVSKRTRLPLSTVVACVISLESRGLLIASPLREPGAAGRPKLGLSVDWGTGAVAHVAFDRSKTTVTAVRLSGDIVARQTLACTMFDSVSTVRSAIAGWVNQLPASAGHVDYVVAGVPAPIRTRVNGQGRSEMPLTNGVPGLNDVARWLRDNPGEILAAALGIAVCVENDANLAALGEATLGAALDGRVVIHLTLDEGLGAGIVLDGEIHRGASGLAGEIAHVAIDEHGRLCHCGSRGCLATMTQNSPKLAAEVSRAYGRLISVDDLLALAELGDVGIGRILHDLGGSVGKALAGFSSLMNPDFIVVEASLRAAAGMIADGIREQMLSSTAPMVRDGLSVVVGDLPDTAATMGTLALARQRYLAEKIDTDTKATMWWTPPPPRKPPA